MRIFKFPNEFCHLPIAAGWMASWESPRRHVLASPHISSSIGGFAVIARWVLNVHFPCDSREPFSTLTGQLETWRCACPGVPPVLFLDLQSLKFAFFVYFSYENFVCMCIADTLCHNFSCRFVILLVYGWRKYLIFVWPNPSNFSLMVIAFWILFKNLSPSEDREDVLLFCLFKSFVTCFGVQTWNSTCLELMFVYHGRQRTQLSPHRCFPETSLL